MKKPTNFIASTYSIIYSRMHIVKVNAMKLVNDIRLNSDVKRNTYNNRIANADFDKDITKKIYDKYISHYKENHTKDEYKQWKGSPNYVRTYMGQLHNSYEKSMKSYLNDDISSLEHKKYYTELKAVIKKDMDIIDTLESFYVNTYTTTEERDAVIKKIKTA